MECNGWVGREGKEQRKGRGQKCGLGGKNGQVGGTIIVLVCYLRGVIVIISHVVLDRGGM